MLAHHLTIVQGLLAGLFIGSTLALAATATSGAGSVDRQLAHMVYFKLKNNDGGSRAKLMAACKTYLSGHEGEVYFAVGSLAADLARDVNDRDWDVSLHIIFSSKEAHDKYQEHPRHLKFIEDNRENWAKVRVFDSYLSPVTSGTSKTD